MKGGKDTKEHTASYPINNYERTYCYLLLLAVNLVLNSQFASSHLYLIFKKVIMHIFLIDMYLYYLIKNIYLFINILKIFILLYKYIKIYNIN